MYMSQDLHIYRDLHLNLIICTHMSIYLCTTICVHQYIIPNIYAKAYIFIFKTDIHKSTSIEELHIYIHSYMSMYAVIYTCMYTDRYVHGSIYLCF